MQALDIQIYNTIDEAPNYNTNGKGILAATLTKAVIVRNGTVKGNDTVDLLFKDDNGKQYVVFITASLLKVITDLTNINGE